MKRGFTLLELIIVVIIVGILATLGFVQYTSMLEKGRKAEARSILGTLRQLEAIRYQETGAYGNLADLSTGVPDASCAATHYFSYSCSNSTGTCTGTRCTSGGKAPDAGAGFNYTVSLDLNGTFSGTGEWQ
ncbi:MAG: prepilin-type N-terminal cleavage/methylation domain-containing protein [Candidatus Omnitrophota bacterium]